VTGEHNSTETAIQREQWRDSFTFQDAYDQCHQTHSKFTMVTLQSGGLLCTLAAIRSTWTPIWGTEICQKHINAPVMCQNIEQIKNCDENTQQQMWKHLTGTTCYGNTFTNMTQYSKLERPMYLKVSPECTYYCIGGAQTGSNSLTGWQLPDIAMVILEIEPLVVQIENSSNAPNVNNGDDVMMLKQRLSAKYKLYINGSMQSYDYGDNIHSERWVCIAIHERMGDYSNNFRFPEKLKLDDPPYCARDIADCDENVPAHLWRKDNTQRTPYQCKPRPGLVHTLARAGPGMGPANNPNLITSWEGATPRPTTTGGAIRHPKLDWTDEGYNKIGPSRLATNNELVRAMSAPNDTISFYARFDESDQYLKRNIGNAISVMMATAIDTKIMQHIKTWLADFSTEIPRAIEFSPNHRVIETAIANLCNSNGGINTLQALSTYDEATQFQAHFSYELNPESTVERTDTYPPIRSAMVDSAANRTFLYCSVEQWMQHPKRSNLIIQVADATTSMQGSKDGKLSMMVVTNPQSHDRQPILEPKARLDVSVTTVKNLHKELISIDEHYIDGFNILFKQPDYEDGIPQMYRPAKGNTPAVKIPFRYDYQNGGFWLDYIPMYQHSALSAKSNEQNEHNILIHKHLHDMNPTDSGPPAEYLDAADAIRQAKEIADKTEVTEVFHTRHAEEREIKGIKAGLRKRKNKMSMREFHEDHMHMGDCPGCEICILVNGTLRRIMKKVDPYKENRVCHTFHMDTITWSHRGFCGSKYEIHITCEASRWPDSLYLYSKSESLDAIEAWIIQIRLDPNFAGMPYNPVQKIVMDNAGEWDLDHAKFQEMGVRHCVEFQYTSKDRKESNARAERAIGVKEPKVKACLLQSNLPPEWVIRVSRQANWLLARFPPQSHSAHCPPDGDRPLPLEVITRGKISRRMIYNQLYYFLNIGTPALVHDATIAGSRLPTQDEGAKIVADCKSRWMVAYGMYRDQVVFWDPRTNDTCRSKSYTAFKLRKGMNFAQLLGCNMPKATEKSRPIPGDFTEKVTIHLPEMRPRDPKAMNPNGPPVQQVMHKSDTPTPTVEQSTPQENGGSVVVKDTDGTIMNLDAETGWLVKKRKTTEVVDDHNDRYRPVPQNNKPVKQNKTNGSDQNNCYVNIESIPNNEWDKLEAQAALEHGYTTALSDTFVRVCKSLKLPMEQHTLYKQWCIKHHTNPYGGKLISEDLPMEKNEKGYVPKLAPNWFFPYPTGYMWRQMTTEPELDLDRENNEYVEALYAEVCSDIRNQPKGGPMTFKTQTTSFAVARAYTTLAQRQSREKSKKTFKIRKKRRGPPQSEGWPASVKQALNSDKPEAWKKAIATEIDKLTERGVFLHDQTTADILAHGITTKVVPLGLYLTEKYDENGELLREKARAAIKGHSGNMQKGIHYFETYAATPQPETARILVCIALIHNWQRRAWDVELAYAWAELPVNERLALAYPKGCERYHPDTGEQLYIILLKNLYGDPGAGRRWSIHRDNKLLSEFNSHESETEQWTCIRTIMDPCLFHLTLKIKGHRDTYEMLTSIHTDDLDAIGSDDIILEKFLAKANDIWKLKEANPKFMLGIEKLPEYDSDNKLIAITLKMTAFVKGAVEAFRNTYQPRLAVRLILRKTH
jgi:site-specific DNA-cytosine methylase